MTLPTKALSVHAPWAWALMFGGKDVENRSMNFTKKFRGDVWIHASKGPTSHREFRHTAEKMLETLWVSMGWICFEDYDVRTDAMELVKRTMQGRHFKFPPRMENLKAIRGLIIGRVRVESVLLPSDPPDSSWYIPGNMAMMVSNPRPLAVPVPAKGALGYWNVPDDVLEKLEGQC